MIRKRRPFFVRLSAFDPFAHADGTDLSVSTTNIPLLGPSWPKLKFSKIKLPDHVSLSTFFPRSSFVGYSRVCRTPADWRMFGCLYSANIRDTKYPTRSFCPLHSAAVTRPSSRPWLTFAVPPNRSRLPPSTLNKVSRRTNGNFYDIYDFNDIYNIYDFYEIPITSIKMVIAEECRLRRSVNQIPVAIREVRVLRDGRI